MDLDNDVRTTKCDPRNVRALDLSKLRYFPQFVNQISSNYARMRERHCSIRNAYVLLLGRY